MKCGEAKALVEQALSDVKVLDLTHYVAGPYCTKLLADCGADVIKVEKPNEGDGARRLGPFFKDQARAENSGLFLYLNTNKRGITLNLKSTTGKKIFKQLVKGVDILVENFSPRVMPGSGLGYEVLEKVNPKLVMTSISNFGQTGPYRDYKATEIIIDGMGQAMNARGLPEREPVKTARGLLLCQSGLIGAIATMTALFSSRLQGFGQQVDISIMETQLGSINGRALSLVGHQYNPGEVSLRLPQGMSTGFPTGNWPCKDGYISIDGGQYYGFWPRVVDMLDMPELLEDRRFCIIEAQASPENYEAFVAIFLPWCMERTKQEIFIQGQAKRVLVAPINTAEDLLNDPNLSARGYFLDIVHPMTGKIKYPGAPIKGDGFFQVRRPAPLLGEHNEEVYEQLGYSKEELVKLREWGVI